MKHLKQAAWYLLGVAEAAGSFFIGYFSWKYLDPAGVVYKTPQDLGTLMVMLHLIYELQKLKHPAA